jgi:Mrp family chromosome partitioning ATPase/capsular polysaccharide biosynthesis protein
MFASVCAGIAFIVLSPAYYTASSTILLEDRTLRPPAELIGGAFATDPAYSESQVQVLQSDEVLGRVVDQNRLGENEEFGKAGGGLRALVSYLASAFLGPGAQVTPRHTATVNIRRGLSISRLGTSNAVEIAFTSRNPVSAAMIANAIGQTYIDSQLELKREARADAASQVRDRLAELRKRAFPVDQHAPDAAQPPIAEAGEQVESHFKELQNSTETYRILYNNFLQRGYTESVEDSSLPGPRMITSAERPAEQSWPRPALILVAAVGCGLVGGVGHALLRQATDHRLRTMEDLQWSTMDAFVAGIPDFKERLWLGSTDSQQESLQAVYARNEAVIYDLMGKVAAKLQAAVNYQTRSKSAAGRSQEGSTSIIGVVAPIEGAGVSLIASHLARIIAESGQRTILVDANWRKPVGAPAGLNAGCRQALESTYTTIQLNPFTLDILTLRAIAPISELSASLSIVSALEGLEADYDWIVVDFNSTEQTSDFEASVSIINTAIVIVEAGSTSSECLSATLRMIPRSKVGALILNKIQQQDKARLKEGYAGERRLSKVHAIFRFVERLLRHNQQTL